MIVKLKSEKVFFFVTRLSAQKPQDYEQTERKLRAEREHIAAERKSRLHDENCSWKEVVFAISTENKC